MVIVACYLFARVVASHGSVVLYWAEGRKSNFGVVASWSSLHLHPLLWRAVSLYTLYPYLWK